MLDYIGRPSKTGVRVWCAYEKTSKYSTNNMTKLITCSCRASVIVLCAQSRSKVPACMALRTFIFRAAEVACKKLYKIN